MFNKEVTIKFPLHVVGDVYGLSSIRDADGREVLCIQGGSSYYSWEQKPVALNIVKILNENADKLSTIDVTDYLPKEDTGE